MSTCSNPKYPKLPVDFINQLHIQSSNIADQLIASLDQNPNTSIRLNPFKPINKPEILVDSVVVPWCDLGHILPSRPSFTLDPLYHAGAYYPQESSSMFISQFLDASRPLKVLDLCASPGGKSSLLLSCLHPDSLVVANEIDSLRCGVLRQNLNRFGNHNVIITNNTPADFGSNEVLDNFFDLILVDAPCSGEGMFRKDDQAINNWNLNLVQNCANTQKQILTQILPCLKNGGQLIYSTCTYNQNENEQIVDWLVQTQGVTTQNNVFFEDLSSVISSDLGYHFYPHLTSGEGFFCSNLLKLGVDSSKSKPLSKRSLDNLYNKPEYDDLFIKKDPKIKVVGYSKGKKTDRMQVLAIPSFWYDDIIRLIGTGLKITKLGVDIGEWKGGAWKESEWLPSHNLAASDVVSSEVPVIELDKTNAIKYLKKETMDLEIDNLDKIEANMWCLVAYQNQNLGWIKILKSGEIKNYLPTELRIRMS